MPATPESQLQSMIANLPEKTGRSLDQWLGFLKGREGEKHGALVAALKAEGVTHGYANLIAQTFRAGGDMPGAEAGTDEARALVEAQFQGKESLRPVYDFLVATVRGFGGDVEVAPKKTYVSLRRSKQFGLVQPSTKTRLDLGLKLAGVEPSGRLEASGSFNSMVTHRVRLEKPSDVDAQVKGWLRQAYDQG